jgi:hypothetical protein
MNAKATVTTHKLHYLHSHGFPFMAVIGAISVFIAGEFGLQDPVLAVNAMSVLFSTLSLLIFFLLARRMINETGAIFSTLLFSFSPIFLGNSVYGNSHMPSLFLLLSGILGLYSYLTQGRQRYLWISVIFFGLAGGTRLQDTIVLLMATSLYILLLPRLPQATSTPSVPQDKFSIIIYLIAASAGITLLLYLPLLGERFAGEGSSQQWRNFFEFELRSRFVGPAWQYITTAWGYLVTNFSPIGLILAGTGLVLVFGLSWPTAVFLLMWAIIPFVLYSMLDIMVPRFFIITLVPLYLAQGFACAYVWKMKRIFRLSLILVLLFLLTCHTTLMFPSLLLRHHRALIPEFAQWIQYHTSPNAVIIAGDEHIFIRYYGQRETLRRPRQVHRPYTPEELERFRRQINTLLDHGIPVYFTMTGLYSHDPYEQFANFLKKHYRFKLLGWRYRDDWHRGVLEQIFIRDGLIKMEYPQNTHESLP